MQTFPFQYTLRNFFLSVRNEFLITSASATEIRNIREKLLLSFGNSNLACVVPKVLTTTLKHTPSLTEVYKCRNKECINEPETTSQRPYLDMAPDVFKGSMENIERSITANLNLVLSCRKCKTLTVNVCRTFGEHLFIEVSSLKLFLINFMILRWQTIDIFYVTQIPVSSLEMGKGTNAFEKIVTFKVEQLKWVICINQTTYSLFGLVIFRRPLLKGSVGHYIAAVKVKNEFVIFDDLHNYPYILNKDESFVIHCLFYKKLRNWKFIFQRWRWK